MTHKFKLIALLGTLTLFSSCYTRHVRVAEDITPGNYSCGEKLDWRYGATDIKIQTSKVTRDVMDKWFFRTGYNCALGRPRITITEVDNRTDCYISTDMIRDIFEGIAVDDGRFTIVVGDKQDENDLDISMDKLQSPKYSFSSKPCFGQATAPQFLAKVRITKAKTAQPRYDLEDYRMSITLYDIQSQEIIDSSWDVLSKKVFR